MYAYYWGPPCLAWFCDETGSPLWSMITRPSEPFEDIYDICRTTPDDVEYMERYVYAHRLGATAFYERTRSALYVHDKDDC